MLEASGQLGTAAGAFLEHLRSTLRHFSILRFRALVSKISVKHNVLMALRWVRYLRHPILDAEIATLSDICTCYLLS